MNEADVHFVQVSFDPVSEQEMGLLLDQDGRLNDLFNDPSTVEYDGFERGPRDFVMYFYGANADRMALLIVPELRSLPCRDRAIVVRRYGDHGSRQETTKLAV